jgi:hypothetical protein
VTLTGLHEAAPSRLSSTSRISARSSSCFDRTSCINVHVEDVLQGCPDQRLTLLAFATDCDTGGQYRHSQGRLARRAGRARQHVNRSIKGFAQGTVLHVPEKRRHFHHPKTISFTPRVMFEITRAVRRAITRALQGDSRRSKTSVGSPRGPRRLPSLEEILPRFKRKHRYAGGWMVLCPAHNDQYPSLSISEGRTGKLLLYCHAGCSHAEVRAKLGLPPPRKTSSPRTPSNPSSLIDWDAPVDNVHGTIPFDVPTEQGQPATENKCASCTATIREDELRCEVCYRWLPWHSPEADRARLAAWFPCKRRDTASNPLRRHGVETSFAADPGGIPAGLSGQALKVYWPHY